MAREGRDPDRSISTRVGDPSVGGRQTAGGQSGCAVTGIATRYTGNRMPRVTRGTDPAPDGDWRTTGRAVRQKGEPFGFVGVRGRLRHGRRRASLWGKSPADPGIGSGGPGRVAPIEPVKKRGTTVPTAHEGASRSEFYEGW